MLYTHIARHIELAAVARCGISKTKKQGTQ